MNRKTVFLDSTVPVGMISDSTHSLPTRLTDFARIDRTEIINEADVTHYFITRKARRKNNTTSSLINKSLDDDCSLTPTGIHHVASYVPGVG
jgi:hypothetical protein